ncbi:MAG TPA: redox-sensing transcriptional repressor Rex [Planctomycetota bacterium]|jgi:redox-sensing transcriptional repressor
MANTGPISEATLRRMPTYLHLLYRYLERGEENVSCSAIGAELNLDPTQVRKDIEATGVIGKPRVGFAVVGLIGAIEEFLGWNKVNEAFLVGVGHLGTALLGYQRMQNYGVSIIAAFDADLSKVGTQIHGREVLAIERLTDLAKRMHVHVGIITVPAEHAQKVADVMVAGGIQAIWNFAPVSLRVPEHVLVRNEELYYSLAALSRKLAQNFNMNNAHRQEVSTHGNDASAAAEPLTQV